MNSTHLTFAKTARDLGYAAQIRGLEFPVFTSPPKIDGCDRTIKRTDLGVVAAIRLKERPWVDVETDMVEAIVVANCLSGELAVRARLELSSSLHSDLADAA